eukprot:TRINITY_DN9400_c4_g1_i2.p1 TRINITY_DN9400_c4_g1~~TRINITY_DN9400_c4_g1_i2.p1  ORF type:complete len:380 (-),score=72.06 TRINITY_DN9400_c4_g1_i2:145-1239(-)
MAGDARRAKWALEAHAQPHAISTPAGLYPLHVAAIQGHVQVAQVLMDAQANPSSLDTARGLSPLSMACLGGHREVVNLLLCHHVPLDGPEGDGACPLLHAAYRNFPDICEVLLDAGASPHVTYACSFEPWRVREVQSRKLVNYDWQPVVCGEHRGGVKLDLLRVEGVTALHLAAWHGSTRLCASLIEAHARPSVIDTLERSPLMFAAERGCVEVTSLLVERNASFMADGEGHTAASLAARAGHANVITVLLDTHECEVNMVPWAGGPTMLHMAVYHRQTGVVITLLERRADSNAKLQPGGVTALMLAALRGSSDICQQLLTYQADVNEADVEGASAWLRAALAGRNEVCRLLATYGATEDAREN